MRIVLFGFAVLFLVSPAFAEDLRSGLIEMIDSMRDDESRRDYRVVLPARVPAVPKNVRLRVEFGLGHRPANHGRIVFVPKGTSVTVSYLTHGRSSRRTRTLSDRGLGTTFTVGEIPGEAYRTLVTRLLLAESSRLECREGQVPADRRAAGHTSSDGLFHIEAVAGKDTLISGDLGVSVFKPHVVLGKQIDDLGRALLYVALVSEAASEIRTRSATEVERRELAAQLMKELSQLGKNVIGYRRRLRIDSLGSLGYAEAVPVLKAQLAHPYMERCVQVALRKIEILNLKNPRKALEALMRHPAQELRDWAEAELKARYGKDFRKFVIALFSSGDPAHRLEALLKLQRLAPSDLTLARRGMVDPHPKVRVPSAARIWDAEKTPECTRILLEVAADRSLVSWFAFFARTEAIEALTWFGPRGDVDEIRDGLTAIARDEKDDVTARGSALFGLGCLGDRKAIPTILEIFLREVPEEPVYLHAAPDWVTEDMVEEARSRSSYLQSDDVRQDAVRSLGILRAKTAVPHLQRLLVEAPLEFEHNLRMWAAQALARMGDPKSRKALETWAGRLTDDDSHMDESRDFMALYTALTSKDPAKALLDHLNERGRWSDSTWIEIALADLAGEKRLSEFSSGDYCEQLREIIANARKRLH